MIPNPKDEHDDVCLAPHIFVGKVVRCFFASRMCQVALWEVHANERFGPWSRRKWVPYVDAGGSPQIDMYTEDDILTKVTLTEGALSNESLEHLTMLGVPVGDQPSRDKSLPGIVV